MLCSIFICTKYRLNRKWDRQRNITENIIPMARCVAVQYSWAGRRKGKWKQYNEDGSLYCYFKSEENTESEQETPTSVSRAPGQIDFRCFIIRGLFIREVVVEVLAGGMSNPEKAIALKGLCARAIYIKLFVHAKFLSPPHTNHQSARDFLSTNQMPLTTSLLDLSLTNWMSQSLMPGTLKRL